MCVTVCDGSDYVCVSLSVSVCLWFSVCMSLTVSAYEPVSIRVSVEHDKLPQFTVTITPIHTYPGTFTLK